MLPNNPISKNLEIYKITSLSQFNNLENIKNSSKLEISILYFYFLYFINAHFYLTTLLN